MLTYEEYGLKIRSPIPLANRVAHADPVDIVVRFGHVGALPSPSETLNKGTNVRVTKRGIFLHWDHVGTLLVREGREIVIDPVSRAEERTLRDVLLGAALATVLHQRGRLVLHASAVAIGDGVVAFIGMSGQGKSTLALAFYACGYKLMADDITSIEFDGTTPIVFPACPQINASPEVLHALLSDPAPRERLESGREKRTICARERFSTRRLPLRGIYVLDEGAKTSVEPLSPRKALIELIRHSYTVRLLDESDAPDHFVRCAHVVNAAAVRLVKVPRRLDALDEVVQIIVDDLKKDGC